MPPELPERRRGEVVESMTEQRFAIDRSLRILLEHVSNLIADGQGTTPGEPFYTDAKVKVSLSSESTYQLTRVFAGFEWQMTFTKTDLPSLVSGAIREWPMVRVGEAEMTSTMSDDAISRILGSLGFDEDEAEETDEESKGIKMSEDTRVGQRSISGLEDDLEANVDFGSVSESDLDAFLNAYETATGEHTLLKQPEEKTESDPTLALFEKLLTEAEDEGEDEANDAVNEMAIQSARGFLELLLNNEKLELDGSRDLDPLATGLAPLLEQELPGARKAEMIIDWLLDQDNVEDIFVSDEEMIALLNAW